MISSPSGSVGVSPVINIRGVSSISNSTTPLYVVDGMIISMDGTSSTRQNPLADINSADIKSIEILKDAAATALYGSRAANGVIMITTNSGQKGKAKISYNGSYTVTTPTNMIEAMNAEQYVELKNLAVSNTASRQSDKGFYDKYAYGLMYDSNGDVVSTDWSDLLFQTGSIMNHDLNVSGGNDTANYYISTGIMNQDGITVGDEFKRYSFKANTNFNPTDWLSGGFTQIPSKRTSTPVMVQEPTLSTVSHVWQLSCLQTFRHTTKTVLLIWIMETTLATETTKSVVLTTTRCLI